MTLREASLQEVLKNPVMEVFAIDNGYLLITHYEADDARMIVRKPDIIYAKDEIGIAEEIIAAQARHKLDVEPKQGEMFTPEESGPLDHYAKRMKEQNG